MRLLRAFVVFSALLVVSAFCSQQKTVRIAYFPNENFQEGSSSKEALRGYAYDYYQKLAQYTGWKYEYVFGTFDVLYQMFLNGELDLIAGLARTQSREGLMGFPQIPMGSESYILQKRAYDETLTNNPKSLQDKKIGVLTGAMEQALKEHLQAYSIKADIVIFQNMNERDEALRHGDVDAILTENLWTGYGNEVETFAKVGNVNFFICVNINRPDLLEELNEAQAIMLDNEPYLTLSLYDKYARYSSFSRKLTSREKKWLETHDTLRVAYLKNMLPYSDENQDGNLQGVIKDVLSEMGKQLNLNPEITFQGYDNYDDMVKAVVSGEKDMAFPTGGSLYYAEQNGIYQSAPVIKSKLDLVFKGIYNENVFRRFAVNINSKMMIYYIKENFPNAEIIYRNSIEECLDAVLSGKATATVVGNLRSTHLLKKRKYKDLSVKLLNISNDKYFGVAIGNEALLQLLNRGLSLMGDEFTTNLSYKYAVQLHKDSLTDILAEHMYVVFLVISLIALLCILMFIRRFRRIQKQALHDREQNEKLSMQIDVIKAVSDLYHSVSLVDLEKNSFTILHAIDKIVQTVEPFQNDAQKAFYLIADNLVRPDNKAQMREFFSFSYLKKVLSLQDVTSLEYEGVSMGWCRVSAIAVRRNSKRIPTLAIIISQEINQQKENEIILKDALASAERANKAKTLFLNNMSHDIRTPMNAIIGFTALASTHIDNKDQVKDYLGKITTSSKHLLSLINDVLDMRRIESGKVKLEEQDMRLSDLLHDLKTIVQTSVNRKQQDLYIDAMDVVHEDIVADKLRLNQVLLNLLSNAIKFTKAYGTISVRIQEKPCESKDRARFEFRVKDNGIGMNAEFQKHIFEAFTREETSTVSGIQGTGLGMAITKNIVDMMGGTIEIHSEENVGTEFVVTLEFKLSQKQNMKTAEESKIPHFDNSRVLLAEDNLLNQEIAITILTETGLAVDVANNGLEAIEMMKQSPAGTYRLILMDIQMPIIDGYEATRQIRSLEEKEKACIPIIAMTANAFDDDAQKARVAGMNEHLSKPIDVQALMKALAKFLH